MTIADGMPPAVALLAAACILPLLPSGARRALCVLASLAALLLVLALSRGTSWATTFLGYEVVLVRADALSIAFGVVFGLIALAGNVYGWRREGIVEQVAGLVYAGGGLAVVFAGDLISMLVAWEVMAVSSAVLVFCGDKEASLRAGQRYLMVHLAAGSLLLLGVLLALGAGGGSTFEAMTPARPGFWLILSGLCINAAVPPLHAWLPDAYPRATVSGSVLLSAFTTKAAVYCLIRAFAGTEALVWAGAVMAVYGVVFAVLENDLRRLLAYHIVSQVGYMVCAVGVGTPMAINGATAHAFCHILYKGLLFMGVGAVIHATGREKLSDLGGLMRSMPLTLLFYMVGALSISGAPLFNGFVSKSLVVAAAGEDGRAAVVLLLQLAAVGTFLSVGLKLPYYAWVAPGARVEAREAPTPMLLAMGGTALLCVFLGVAPGVLYAGMPFTPVEYHPYVASHLFEMLLLMAFTALAFWQLRGRLEPHAGLTLDTDWVYRRAATWLVSGVAVPLGTALARGGAHVAAAVERLKALTHNPPLEWDALLRAWAGEGAGGAAGSVEGWYDPERQRPPVARNLTWVLILFAAVGLVALLAGWQ